MGGGDQSEAHSALIHVDAHLILITKMQFPASQRRLMGNCLSKCFLRSAMPPAGWMTFKQTELIHRLIYLIDLFMTNWLSENIFNTQ